ncbi:MAG: hypothetical protein WAW53_08430 [Candidatus Dormiibacterota bacterium]
MTESVTSPALTTEQLAGTDATTAEPPAGSSAPPAAATTADPVRTNGDTSNDVTIPGQSSRPTNGTSGEGAPLLANNAEFMARWTAIQTTFVDEPRTAVEQADTLVAEVIRELARVFAEERAQLEGAWSRGTDVSTEDLRQALQRYRDFFHLLLRS